MRSLTMFGAAFVAFAGVTDAFLTAACVMPNYIYDLLRLKEGEEPVSTDPQHPTTSGEGCQAWCFEQGATYSIYSWDPVSEPYYFGQCVCTSRALGATMIEFSKTDNVCYPEDNVITYLPSTPYEMYDCQEPGPTFSDGMETDINDFHACLSMCEEHGYNYVSLKATGNYQSFGNTPEKSWTCQCGSAMASGETAGGCHPQTAFVYRHIQAAPSGVARKRKLRADAERASLGHCPRGLHACAIPGAEHTYECLDTSTELEYCGGCSSGYFDNVNGTIGTDCSRIDGVALGGVSCVRGHCQVTHCRKGYHLKHGKCVRRFGFDF